MQAVLRRNLPAKQTFHGSNPDEDELNVGFAALKPISSFSPTKQFMILRLAHSCDCGLQPVCLAGFSCIL